MKKHVFSWFFMLAAFVALATPGLYGQNEQPDPTVMTLIETEDPKAEAAINERLKADASNPANHYLKGYYFFRQEDYTKSLAAFQNGVKAKSKNPFNHIGMANAYSKLERSAERDKSLETALTLLGKKTDANAMIMLADAYLQAQKLEEAKVYLYRIREEFPNDPRGWIMLGNYYEMKGVKELIQENYEKAIQLDPNYSQGYLSLGRLALKNKKWEDGWKYLNEAIKRNPSLSAAYSLRGELYLKAAASARMQGSDAQYKEYVGKATGDYEKYLSMVPDDYRAKYRYAQFLYLKGDFEQSISMLNQVDTTTLVKLRLLGYSHAELNQLDKAKSYMTQFFKMAGDKEGAILYQDWETMGKIALKDVNDPQALDYFLSMFKADTEGEVNPGNYLENIAKNFADAKDFKREVFWRNAVVEHKERRELKDYFNLGFGAYRAEMYEEAKSAFEKVVELKADWEPGQYWLGSTIYKMNPEATDWPSQPAFQQVFDLLKAKPVSQLTGTEKSHSETVCVYLALYSFNPKGLAEPKLEDVSCEAAKPYVDRVLEINPENTQVADILNFCKELDEKKSAKGGK